HCALSADSPPAHIGYARCGCATAPVQRSYRTSSRSCPRGHHGLNTKKQNQDKEGAGKFLSSGSHVTPFPLESVNRFHGTCFDDRALVFKRDAKPSQIVTATAASLGRCHRLSA